jgi:hypothetical protein
MKKLLTILLMLSASAFQTHAQEQRPAPPVARLIDSFGEIQWSDLMARLDNFAIELQNDPTSRGLIVAYAAQHKFPGWPSRRGHMSQDYLVSTRGLAPERVSTFLAGLRDEATFELWLVPAGAEPPAKPFDPMLLMSGEKRPVPFDRFSVIERGDRSESEYGDLYPDSPGLYEYFAEVLRRDPALRGCVIGYASRHGSLAAGRRIASRAKLSMAKAHAVDVSRVVAVGGGRREAKMLELWLVPPGAELPKPSPDVRPARRKRR